METETILRVYIIEGEYPSLLGSKLTNIVIWGQIWQLILIWGSKLTVIGNWGMQTPY
jgi:hypothetical protein